MKPGEHGCPEKALTVAQERAGVETPQSTEIRLKLVQLQLEGCRRELGRATQNYERERAWCRYLEQNIERLKEFILVNGHTAGCASRKAECCPGCGDSTYDHHCELPFDCNCGFHDMLQPLPREADHVR
jgi:hypothetical protein